MRPELPAVVWDTVRRAYAEPGRAYHGLRHLDSVLAQYDEVQWEHPLEALLALAFHDAVYVPGASDNEKRSAALASEVIARWVPHADPRRVAREIELTAKHGLLKPEDVDSDEALVLDCDMAILGAPPGEYDAYEQGIAEEYAAVPREAFVAGRAAFLERLLSLQRIFLSTDFHARLDAPARANLRRSLRALRGGVDVSG